MSKIGARKKRERERQEAFERKARAGTHFQEFVEHLSPEGREAQVAELLATLGMTREQVVESLAKASIPKTTTTTTTPPTATPPTATPPTASIHKTATPPTTMPLTWKSRLIEKWFEISVYVIVISVATIYFWLLRG